MEHDYESESISMKQIFLILNVIFAYEPLRKSVTKWTLLIKKVQYNVFDFGRYAKKLMFY